jgi:DNA-binding NarL/FixJ family response regulator
MNGQKGTIRVLLADDHRLIIDGLRLLLEQEPGIECVGVATDGARAVHLAAQLNADVVLMDLDMPVLDGFAATQHIKAVHPGVKVLVLTMHGEIAMVARAMDIGADGYLVKNCSRQELLLAIRSVHAGQRHFGNVVGAAVRGLRDEVVAKHELLKELSEREVQVLAALAEGLGNKEIGERLFISPRTVDTHRTNIMRKLGVHHVPGLVRIAIKAGLVK